MPTDKAPLMDAAALSRARPLLWLLLTISALVFLAVAVETLGDVADGLGSRSPSSSGSLVSSIVTAIVLLGLLLWPIVALLLELREWRRVIADPLAFTEIEGTVTASRKVLGLPQFLSTGVLLDVPWNGRDTVRLLTTNGSAIGGGARTGQIAPVGERVRIQVYDGARGRRIAIAGSVGLPAHRTNLTS